MTARVDPAIAISMTLCSATLGEDGQREPPLGPLYIAAALEQCGVTIDFRDYQLDVAADPYSGRPLAQFLADHATIVGISCFVDMLPAVIEATRMLHELAPETIFVLGGPGPTAAAQRILEAYGWIDAVVRGEGEDSIQQWVRVIRGEAVGPVPGAVYRHGGELVNAPDRARNRALDQLPLPAYHLVDMDSYTHARVITTRGCSYRCSFCDVTALWGNQSVYRSLGEVVREMEMLRDDFGHKSISIVDDTFVLNRQRVRDFCHMLIERRSGIEWGCFGRINLMSSELIELMALAGCRAIFYGIDSGSQPVLDRTVKKVRVEDVLPVLKTSSQFFQKIEASFIWGYPFESIEDFHRTLDLAAEASMLAPAVNVQLHLLSPLPLSPIYREFGADLIEPAPDDQRWLLLPALLLDARAASLRELIRAAPDIYPGFFTFPTPDRITKVALLDQTMRAVDRTIGRTLFDPRVRSLLVTNDESLNLRLLEGAQDSSDRIGIGLALGFFQRMRMKVKFDAGHAPFVGSRGPRITRERLERTS